VAACSRTLLKSQSLPVHGIPSQGKVLGSNNLKASSKPHLPSVSAAFFVAQWNLVCPPQASIKIQIPSPIETS
jgi:hypothetical protein